MRTEESVKCSESRGIKYLTVREQEPWDRIFYYSMEAEVQHVPRYKGGAQCEDGSLHLICQIAAGPRSKSPPSPSLFNISATRPPKFIWKI